MHRNQLQRKKNDVEYKSCSDTRPVSVQFKPPTSIALSQFIMLALPIVLLLSVAAFAAPVEEIDNEAQAAHGIVSKIVPAQSTFTKSAVQKEYKQKPFDYQQDHVQGHSFKYDKSVEVAGRQQANEMVPYTRIVKQDMEVNPDGSFYNVWNSENGISVQEQGVVKRVGDVDVAVSNGKISYLDNDGQQFHLEYVADENGFRVKGDHLPTPPPLPIGIARGLQYISAHPYIETTTVNSQNYFQQK